MNNKINIYSLLLSFAALLLFSCSQEDMPGAGGVVDDSRIVFFVSLPAAESRAANTTVASNLNDGFYVSALCPEDNVSSGNVLNEFLSEQFATPLEEMPGYFGMFDEESSELCVWPSSRHSKQGQLKFFAFYPSREVLRQNAEAESGDFSLINRSTKNGATVTYDYRIEKFKINKEIANHIDFVTATAEGSKNANSATGLRLDFEHQLSRITLKAWGDTPNDIEIAGVRLGSVITESDFNFAKKPANLANGDATVNGDWIAPKVKGCVEYIFREGDTVVKIGNGNHTKVAQATSIMGNGEWATVIPADNTGWNHIANDKGLYFSVLLRVKEDDESHTLVYPYVIGGSFNSELSTDVMNVIFLSIDSKTGKVMKRVYRNKDNRKYYIDPGYTTEYIAPQGEEIRNYGWAAVPLSPKITYRWKPGYQYTYILDYSEGVGVHAPDEVFPGKPIISKILVGVTEAKQTWPMVVDNFTKGGEKDITGDIKVE